MACRETAGADHRLALSLTLIFNLMLEVDADGIVGIFEGDEIIGLLDIVI